MRPWMIVAVTVILLWFTGVAVRGVVQHDADSKKERQKLYSRVIPKPTEWCVNICMKDVFSNFHTRSRGIGTASSSMNGMQQADTLKFVIEHCRTIYRDACYRVHVSGTHPHIHTGDYPDATSNVNLNGGDS